MGYFISVLLETALIKHKNGFEFNHLKLMIVIVLTLYLTSAIKHAWILLWSF